MPIKLRRGLESGRTSITPESGEPIWVTDEKKLYVGDGSTAGGILVSGGGGSSWTNVTVTDANITAINDRRYYLPAGVLTADRTVNVSGITSKVAFVVAEDAFVHRLTFTGATVYEYGGAETTDGVMGRGSSVFEVIGGKLIRTQ